MCGEDGFFMSSGLGVVIIAMLMIMSVQNTKKSAARAQKCKNSGRQI